VTRPAQAKSKVTFSYHTASQVSLGKTNQEPKYFKPVYLLLCWVSGMSHAVGPLQY